MGGALLDHWMSGGEDFTIVDPMLDKAPEGVRLVSDRSMIADEKFDTIIVAIKPQMIDHVLPDYASNLAKKGYVLSIAAGASAARLAKAMDGAPVVRVMPNLPAAVGRGTSGVLAGPTVTDAQSDHAMDMMRRTGTAIAVESEDMLDRATAVAGSGPGYVFEIARSYVAAAQELGFDADQARALVLGTMEGTIAMALAKPDTPLEELRNSVTSKGGTTAAGLDALNGDGGLSEKLTATLTAAYERAVDLR